MAQRLQKFIAQSGLCSRRRAEELLAEGRVTVDGAAAHLGDSAEPTQVICVDGKPVTAAEKKVYLMLHKPRGYVTTLSDEKGRPTAAELVADCGVRVYPVGRLDMDSEGLLLFTNDGDFMQKLTHPAHQVDKVYEVTVTGELQDCARRLAAVRELEDGQSIVPAQVKLLRQTGGQAVLQVTIHQGLNRQVRRMCARAGLIVKRLRRVQEHCLRLGDLPAGQWRYLTDQEIGELKGSE